MRKSGKLTNANRLTRVVVEVSKAQGLWATLEAVEEAQKSQKPVKMTSSRPISPPRRPLTRSQTGHVCKRKPRDDSPVQPSPALSVAQHKKPKMAGVGMQLTEDAEGTDEERTPEHVPPAPASPQTSPDVPTQSQPISTRNNTMPLTFLNSHASGSDGPNPVRRAPRSRVVLPTPVPNLTKKSRGRRVPTKSSLDQYGAKEGRLYVCNVDGCGKCFFRGEHLKRHIRSIHTHDKPFRCSFPNCEKLFNRHDNLLQHLKVHREPDQGSQRPSPSSENESENENEGRLSNGPDSSPSCTSPPVLPPLVSPHPDLPASTYRSTTPVVYSTVPLPRPSTAFSYSSTQQYVGGTTLSPESPGFSTNMAISSVRTEIPPSPLRLSVKE